MSSLVIRSVRLWAVSGLVVVLLLVITSLALDVRNRLAALESARTDNRPWVLVQTEVEILRLQNALDRAMLGSADLDDVRRWFDVVFSRLNMLRMGSRYGEFLTTAEHGSRIEHVQAFVDRWLPVIDGPDDALMAALPEMARHSSEVHLHARTLALRALVNFSAQTDESRLRVSDTLTRLAIVTSATLLLLAVLALMANRLYRITQRQAAENQRTGARLQMIIATSPDAIVVTNRAGHVVEFNPQAERMFGLSRREVMDRHVIALMTSVEMQPRHVSRLETIIRSAAEAGPQRFELTGRRSDGSMFPLEISLAVSDLSDDALVVGFMRDVSRRQADRQALEQALTRAQAGEKAKADFVTIMSHEMRTPLNGLIGSMDLFKATRLDATQRELLRVMELSGNILLGHADSVLDLARAEAGQLQLSKTNFLLDQVIEDCIANQLGLALNGGNSLRHVPLSGRLGAVTGDPGRLQQILLNLVGNAVKFTRNGTIVVETERLPGPSGRADPQLVEFRVVDTGVGIAEADLPRVFEDFATLDSSFGRAAGGTGLGLGIARRLADAMGGEIGVESEPGEGSVFWLRVPLPSAEPELPSASAVAPASPPKPRLNILVIEDNDINRFLLRSYLGTADHRVTEANDGLEGVALATTTRFDIIITDIAMPRLDGIEAARRIRAGGASAEARIIAVTAHASPDDLERFRKAGMNVCLTKPITCETLLRHLDTGHEPAMAHTEQSGDKSCALQELAEALGYDVTASLSQRMLSEGEQSIVSITTRMRDAQATAKIVHRFAGSCATFGAVALQKALNRLEDALRAEDQAAADRHMLEVSGLWSDFRSDLEQFVRLHAA
jgi:PAS domain S-box-containing protein